MTTAPTPALLPCPFCGSAKVETKNEHTDLSGGYYIECCACLACTGLRYACGEDPRPLLAEQWNRRAELEARKPLPLSDEQIDAIADGMPGGLGGFMKTWGWRQFARKILDLRAPPIWEPQFDCMAQGQEELAIQFCAEIAGPRGKPGRNPDPVRLLEMAEALYQAEFRDHQQTRPAPTQQEIHHA